MNREQIEGGLQNWLNDATPAVGVPIAGFRILNQFLVIDDENRSLLFGYTTRAGQNPNYRYFWRSNSEALWRVGCGYDSNGRYRKGKNEGSGYIFETQVIPALQAGLNRVQEDLIVRARAALVDVDFVPQNVAITNAADELAQFAQARVLANANNSDAISRNATAHGNRIRDAAARFAAARTAANAAGRPLQELLIQAVQERLENFEECISLAIADLARLPDIPQNPAPALEALNTARNYVLGLDRHRYHGYIHQVLSEMPVGGRLVQVVDGPAPEFFEYYANEVEYVDSTLLSATRSAEVSAGNPEQAKPVHQGSTTFQTSFEKATALKADIGLWSKIVPCLDNPRPFDLPQPFMYLHPLLGGNVLVDRYALPNAQPPGPVAIEISRFERPLAELPLNQGESSILRKGNPIPSQPCWVSSVYFLNAGVTSFGNYASYPEDFSFLPQKIIDYGLQIEIDGLTNGRASGSMKGRINGRMNGRMRGSIDGSVNGHIRGNVNGRIGNNAVNRAFNENINGPFRGAVNATINGDVNAQVHGRVDAQIANAQFKGVIDTLEGEAERPLLKKQYQKRYAAGTYFSLLVFAEKFNYLIREYKQKNNYAFVYDRKVSDRTADAQEAFRAIRSFLYTKCFTELIIACDRVGKLPRYQNRSFMTDTSDYKRAIDVQQRLDSLAEVPAVEKWSGLENLIQTVFVAGRKVDDTGCYTFFLSDKAPPTGENGLFFFFCNAIRQCVHDLDRNFPEFESVSLALESQLSRTLRLMRLIFSIYKIYRADKQAPPALDANQTAQVFRELRALG